VCAKTLIPGPDPIPALINTSIEADTLLRGLAAHG
jgi:hypothetical protein